MSIQDIWKKINTDRPWKQWFWVGTIYGMVLLAIGTVGMSLNQRAEGKVVVSTFEHPAYAEGAKKAAPAGAGTVYASKNGTKYYYSDCAGLKRIKEENRVSFAAAAVAETAGYTKAANCH